MSKNKKVNKVVNKAPVVEPKKEVIVDEVTDIEVSKSIGSTIFDKHRKHINTVKEGYLKKLTYAEAIEILRYVQKETGHKLGLNMSCSNCLVELVEIFMRLEDK